jgi:nucleotide-binding universal stress UspA family protein
VANRFQHILVPVALGPRPARLLEIACGLAVEHGARMTLLHVVHAVPDIPSGELKSFYARLRRRAHDHLRRLAASVRDVEVREVVSIGDPSADILAFVNKRNVDLIVIGSHRLARRPGQGLGTTSYRVAIQCPCAVMLVK